MKHFRIDYTLGLYPIRQTFYVKAITREQAFAWLRNQVRQNRGWIAEHNIEEIEERSVPFADASDFSEH